MTADLVLRNGRVVTPTTTFRGGVALHHGRIVAVGEDRSLPAGDTVLDVSGQVITSGLLDFHVHFREPGLTHKEDYTTGSTAAVMGGITCVLDMPNTLPPTSTPEVVAQRAAAIAAQSYCDVVLVGVVVQENVDQIVPMAAAGVVGFKVFMGETIGSLPAPDDGRLVEALAEVAQTGLRIGFHAENNQILQHRARQLRATGRQDMAAFLESRPALCEAEAIQRVALFARYTGAKIHIFHLSSKDGAQMVREWKAKGVDLTAETCPHYLFLPAEQYAEPLRTRLKVNPPVRTSEHAAYLYQALLDGTVDMVATDHAPHTAADKFNPEVWQALSGFTGVETLIPLMLSEAVGKRGLTLNQLVRLCSEAPARIWGVWPRKGSLLPGADGDLTVIDLDQPWTIDEAQLHSKNNITPWHGWQGRGRPVMTIVRGQVVMRDGALVADQPRGQLVRPLATQAAA
ncbi:MAG: allantoinase AllB [Anaerolineales bacterium]|nr:allantoinase AllB [Anaerolineales bacterium]